MFIKVTFKSRRTKEVQNFEKWGKPQAPKMGQSLKNEYYGLLKKSNTSNIFFKVSTLTPAHLPSHLHKKLVSGGKITARNFLNFP